MLLEPADRTVEAALACLADARAALDDDAEWAELALDARPPRPPSSPRPTSWCAGTSSIEDPTTVTPIGLELRMEVELDGLTLRGIIDRLELDADGELVVTDYKTGRGPEPGLRAVPPRRRALLRLPVRAPARRAPGPGPAALPRRPGRHHHRAERAVDPPARAQGARPSGRPSSGPASATTSAPSSPACATGAPTRPTAPPSAATPTRPARSPLRLAADAAEATSRLTDGTAVALPLASDG